MTTALQRLQSGYYNSDPVSEANPGGFDDGGHQVNFPRALADVGAVMGAVLSGAPGLLDTFAEVSAAMGGDPNFAASMATALAGKPPNARQVLGGGLATGGGNLSADRTITVPKATGAEAVTGADDAKAVTPLALKAAREADALATTAAIAAAINALINGAPGALDTLMEFAAALGSDPNFATTMTNALAGKVPNARTVTGAGLATGGGDLSANRTIVVTEASQAEAEAGLVTGVVMTPRRARDHSLVQDASALTVLGRAARYGITTLDGATTFAVRGAELNFSEGFCRTGLLTGATPVSFPGWTFTRTGAGVAEAA